jgi:basic amino acid/polyamine antiporter, APA family
MVETPPRPTLQRRLGLIGLTLYGLGVTIGAGIYVLIGQVAGLAGAAAPFAFLLAAFVAGLTAMSFAELSVRLPHSAGEAVYVRQGLGSPALALVTGLAVALTGMVAAAAVLIGAAGYLATLAPLAPWIIALALIVVLCALAVWGIAESVAAIGLVTLVEIGGLLVILAVAAPATLSGATWPASGDLPLAAGSFTAAVVVAFFAFIGFEDMVNVVEEVRAPQHTMPLAIGLTLIATTVLYVSLVCAALGVAGPAELADSTAPLALVFERATGLSAAPFAVVAGIATVNGVLVLVIMASRVLYGLARQGSLPAALGHVWGRTGTPALATLLVGAAVLAGALTLPIALLAQASSMLTLTSFTLVNVALIALKRRDAQGTGGFRVPVWWPWLAALASSGVLIAELWRLLA